MAIPSEQDSSLAFDFGPAAGEGRYQSPIDLRPEKMLSPAEGGEAEMLVFDLTSTAPLPLLPARPSDFSSPSSAPHLPSPVSQLSPLTTGHPPPPTRFWLDGDVLLCSCPDCRAPMTVRIWLMIADCWCCGASIELTEEEEREAQRVLAQQQRAAARRREAAERYFAAERAGPTAAPPAQPKAPPPLPAAPRRAPPGAAPAPVAPERPAARRAAVRRVRRVDSIRPHRLLRGLLDYAPAWLISLIVHCILLTLLAMFTVSSPSRDGPYITLSTSVAPRVKEGEEDLPVKIGEVEFDLPIPRQADLNDENVREALLAADQDARELRIDPAAADPNLPRLDRVKEQIGSPLGAQRVFAARDPRLRVDMVTREGGTTLSEAAVARGLRWLALNQEADGGWRLDGKHGGISCDSAGASLALLPFLGAGQTHLYGRYQDTVAQGLRWLVSHQAADGDLRAGANNNAGMYAHGQGAIVLCEAYLMTGDEALREPAQKAIDFLIDAQHIGGGWRYQPGMPGDTSVLGWQLMALHSARAANLEVPQAVLENAANFLDTVQSRNGALYAYVPDTRQLATPPMTAEGLLCRIFLGWTKDEAPLGEGVRYLLADHMPQRDYPNIYYWYYATQTLHHYGGPEWEKWNAAMRDILVQMQETRGSSAGSWDPVGEHSNVGGRIYMTSLAVCTLEVYYRHLPIFRQIELD